MGKSHLQKPGARCKPLCSLLHAPVGAGSLHGGGVDAMSRNMCVGATIIDTTFMCRTTTKPICTGPEPGVDDQLIHFPAATLLRSCTALLRSSHACWDALPELHSGRAVCFTWSSEGSSMVVSPVVSQVVSQVVSHEYRQLGQKHGVSRRRRKFDRNPLLRFGQNQSATGDV